MNIRAVDNNTDTQPSVNQLMDDYMAQADAEFKQELELIQELQAIYGNVLYMLLEADLQVNEKIYNDPDTPEIVRDMVKGRIETDKKKLQPFLDQISDIEAKLLKLDPGMQNLVNALNGLMSFKTGNAKDAVGIGAMFLTQDYAFFKKYLDQIILAMMKRAKVDEITKMMSDTNLSNNQLMALASQLLQAQSEEQNVLASLVQDMTNGIRDFHKKYNEANEGANSYNKIETAINWDGASDKKMQDEARMINASGMIEVLTNTISNLGPEMADSSPLFTQLSLMIKSVIKEVMKILQDPSLSQKEKSGQILSLMMFLLGLFQLVKQTVEQQKAKNEKNMAQANQESASTSLADAISNAKIMEEQEKNAKVLKTVMFAAQLVLGTIMTMLAPGVGSALAMAIITALNASGGPTGDSVIAKLTDEIAKATGQTGAQVIVTLMEVAVTLGGGAAMDAVLNRVGAAAVQAAVTAAEQAVTAQVAAAAQQLAPLAINAEAAAAATAVIENVAKDAAEQAAKSVARQFANQSVSSLGQLFYDGGLNGFKKAMEDAVTKAAKQAAETAIQDSMLLAEVVAQGGEVSAKALGAVSTRAANEAIASATTKSLSTVVKEEKPGFFDKYLGKYAKYLGRNPVERSAAAATYGMASTNLMVDSFMAGMKRAGLSEDSDAYQGLEIFMQMVQQLMQMVAQMAGSGMLSPAYFENSPTMLARGLSLLQAGPQAAQGAASIDMYGVYTSQADAQKGLTLASTLSELLQSFMDQMTKNANEQRQAFLAQMQQDGQSTASMAGHLHDGDNAGIRVLVEGAV